MVVSVKSSRIVAIFLIVLAVQMVLTFFLCLNQLSKDVSLINYTIVIDAGHGGKDAGKTAPDGTKESDLNLKYAKTLGKMFDESGFNVVYTRTTEGGLYGLPTKGFKLRDMQARKQIVQNCSANLVISIHMNQFAGQLSRSGPQVFFSKRYGRRTKACASIATNLQRAHRQPARDNCWRLLYLPRNALPQCDSGVWIFLQCARPCQPQNGKLSQYPLQTYF